MRKPMWFVALLSVLFSFEAMAVAREAYIRQVTELDGKFGRPGTVATRVTNLVLSSANPFARTEIPIETARDQLIYFLTEDARTWPKEVENGMERTIRSINEASLIAFMNALEPEDRQLILDKSGVTALMEDLYKLHPELHNAPPFGSTVTRFLEPLYHFRPWGYAPQEGRFVTRAIKGVYNSIQKMSQPEGSKWGPIPAFYLQWILTTKVSRSKMRGEADDFNREMVSYYLGMLHDLKTTEGIAERTGRDFTKVWYDVMDAPEKSPAFRPQTSTHFDEVDNKAMASQLSLMTEKMQDMTVEELATSAERVLNPTPEYNWKRWIRTAAVTAAVTGAGAVNGFIEDPSSALLMTTWAVTSGALTWLTLYSGPKFFTKRSIKKTQVVFEELERDQRSAVTRCQGILR